MDVDNNSAVEELVGNIRRLIRAVYQDTSKMSRQFGLTGAQSAVLRMLFKNGPLSSAALSRRLFVTPSNITGIIDRLVKKGQVERVRQKNDRRVVLITMTEDGETLSRSLPDPIEKKLIAQVSNLETEHVQLLTVALTQILNLIDAKEVADTPLEIKPSVKVESVEVAPVDQASLR